MPTRRTPSRDSVPRRSPTNRSLERGVEILRAFRPGSDLLGNGELAERTALSRATVSRLTATLVGVGLLHEEPGRRGYRLAPAVLSLAHALRNGSPLLRVAAPLMRALAESRRVNVGLAAPDRDEMVYLESLRHGGRAAHRTVASGQRIPMELTSLGRAYLATAPAARRRELLALFRSRRRAQWPALARAIAQAKASVESRGFCVASWQPEVIALAAPLPTPQGHYVVNVSLSTQRPPEAVAQELSGPLLALRDAIASRLANLSAPD